MEKMPPFPVEPTKEQFQEAWGESQYELYWVVHFEAAKLEYQLAISAYWEARARLAVEYISLVNEHGDIGHPDVVLAAIGELPEQK